MVCGAVGAEHDERDPEYRKVLSHDGENLSHAFDATTRAYNNAFEIRPLPIFIFR
jgi:hypothetical protein